MPLKEKYNSIIEKIIEEFGLYNKSDEDDVSKYILSDPGIVISELILKHENNELKEEELSSYLETRLKLTADKSKKLKDEIIDKILSTEEKKFTNYQSETPKEKGPDQYREPIE